MTTSPMRVSRTMRRVLRVLVDVESATGPEIHRAARILFVGRVFPLLLQLERAGWVESQWSRGAYPRHRLYQLTQRGHDHARQVLRTGSHD